MLITELLARNASLYPDESALVELKPGANIREEITWKEFDDRANRVANALIARGVCKGDKVIHLMMNSIHWLEVYFGIIRTGAWAVPLNFRFLSKDIKYCADIAGASVMIFGPEFIDRVEAVRSELSAIKHYIFVGEDAPAGMEKYDEVIAASSSQPVDVQLTGEDTCGLYFTSGTTGAPKPILITHRNVEYAA